jgi:hypothetical protein
VLALAAFAARAPIIRLLGRRTLARRDAALMSALVPKGLAAAVLAGLPAQLGVPGGEAIRGAVYAAVFFSIATCALLVFAIERGLLAPTLARWLGKFPLEAPSAPPITAPQLPALATLSSTDLAELQEPNPVTGLDQARAPAKPAGDG